MRHHVGLEPGHGAGPLVAALGLDAVLDAAREEDLHADADAEHRAPARQPAADDPLALDRAQARHAGGVRADTGHHEPVSGERVSKSPVSVTDAPARSTARTTERRLPEP